MLHVASAGTGSLGLRICLQVGPSTAVQFRASGQLAAGALTLSHAARRPRQALGEIPVQLLRPPRSMKAGSRRTEEADSPPKGKAQTWDGIALYNLLLNAAAGPAQMQRGGEIDATSQ